VKEARSSERRRKFIDASELLERLAWRLQAHAEGREFSEGFKKAARSLREKVDREKGEDHGQGVVPEAETG
jgi:hypothetical protein